MPSGTDQLLPVSALYNRINESCTYGDRNTSRVLQAGNMTFAFQDEISQGKVSPKANATFRLVEDLGQKPIATDRVQYLPMRRPR